MFGSGGCGGSHSWRSARRHIALLSATRVCASRVWRPGNPRPKPCCLPACRPIALIYIPDQPDQMVPDHVIGTLTDRWAILGDRQFNQVLYGDCTWDVFEVPLISAE
jgi:hypothetical protein